ncbi:unnamed protein product [Lymnaea stagnalis]|uniref:RING-type domain-containing protein n=1 Tax=Lymnaea stagnalis TaxID=6523 RepID=A0AAV2I6B0_LYMST
MASPVKNPDPSFDKLSNDFLHCPLCFEQFKNPKVLPCQHTFCLSCLRAYVSVRGFDATIPCPMCKELVLIPDNDVANLKNNFMIVSLLQFVQDSKLNLRERHTTQNQVKVSCQDGALSSTVPALCGACNESGSLDSFCQLCSRWLCKICTKSHSRIPLTADHPLLSMKEVDTQCKGMVDVGEKAVTELQLANMESQDFLISQIQDLPDNASLVQHRINAAAKEAHQVVQEKADDLTQQLQQFMCKQEQYLSEKLDVINERKDDLEHLQNLLTNVKISNDGYENQKAIKTVESFLNSSSKSTFSPQSHNSLSLAFVTYNNNLIELKQLEMGQLRVVSKYAQQNPLYLSGRPLTVHRISSLVEREYISALAINKFADKFVVANNQTVFVFKPDSKIPKSFLSPLSERTVNKPWGLAYCEDERRVYISEAGRHEGDGAVVTYSHDGAFHSVIASGLTLPRGLAVHKSYIFVCDQIDRCVYILTMWGKVIRVLKKTADGRYLFNAPMFISVGKNGVIAVTDNCTSVKIFNKDCNLLFTYTSNLPESQFWDVHVMLNGVIVVCDWKHGLHKISPDFSSNGLVATETNILREPSALAALENGNSIYIGTCGGEIFSAI